MIVPGYAVTGTTDVPATWPDLPKEMTFTTLSEIESCPRRWALGAAHYPEIWEGRGYPQSVQPSTAAGSVVHLALETIMKGLVSAGCASVQDPAVFNVMKSLGGYTTIINKCADQVLGRFADNPRAQGLLESVSRFLRSQAPDLRTRTQNMFSRIRLLPEAVPRAKSKESRARNLGPLTMGVFPEVGLRANKIHWRGRADLLVLSPERCEITDFKTGVQHENHKLQLQIYALLWSRDTELNPTRRLADRLVLAYENGEVEVAAPSYEEIDSIEDIIVARDEGARKAASQSPPEARPGIDHCPCCGVRQLCSEYWTAKTQRMINEPHVDARFGDIELTVTGRHGPSSWDARVQLSSNIQDGKSAVLRTKEGVDFQVGARLRVLGAAIVLDAEDRQQPAVITLGAASEVYVVTKS
ncbi:MAG: hypothetical protein C4575_05770 [Desulforudis sp.]|nr:MAG: hypothetical protein C4575_05770 [Desulforudis sp.]